MKTSHRLAIIADSAAPYRVHLHRRLAREIQGLSLWSVFTHDMASGGWSVDDLAEIRPVAFGAGHAGAGQSEPRYALREWRKGGAIIRWLSDTRVDAVVLFGYADTGRLRIIEWCRTAEIPCFLFGDSNALCDTPNGWRSRLKAVILPRILRRCTGVMCCGRRGADYFRRYGVDNSNIFQFPYEPDYDVFFDRSEAALLATRAVWELSRDRRRLVYSGRLVPVKRVDLLISAFVRIAASRPNWDLVVAGTGPLQPELAAAIPDAVRARVQWVGFVKEQSTLASLYHCSDVLVLPSDYEPWGVVVTEAAAASLALVCSSVVGAAAEVLEDGVNGRTFAKGNGDELTAALLEVTSDGAIDKMKAASRGILDKWRRESNPVDSLRAALCSAGLLAPQGD